MLERKWDQKFSQETEILKRKWHQASCDEQSLRRSDCDDNLSHYFATIAIAVIF
jgi:hypothetical protein